MELRALEKWLAEQFARWASADIPQGSNAMPREHPVASSLSNLFGRTTNEFPSTIIADR
jgi:hypothetical protein